MAKGAPMGRHPGTYDRTGVRLQPRESKSTQFCDPGHFSYTTTMAGPPRHGRMVAEHQTRRSDRSWDRCLQRLGDGEGRPANRVMQCLGDAAMRRRRLLHGSRLAGQNVCLVNLRDEPCRHSARGGKGGTGREALCIESVPFIRTHGICTKTTPRYGNEGHKHTPSHLSVAFSTAHALLALVFSNLASQSGTSCPASRAIRARAGAHSLS